MEPDTKNTWMDADVGRFDVPLPEGTKSEETREKSTGQDLALAAARIVFALLFAVHGAQKLFGIFGGEQMLHDPWLATAGILEVGGGILIALGYLTRPVAFVLCGEMAVAYFKVHFPGGFLPIINRGEVAVLYCFFFLYLAVRGAGAVSIDGLRGKA
jgi:putative oxidoreductase